jgi:structural maintenance of chromosome 3 (chondroitin sulfate proteoglycan 6)
MHIKNIIISGFRSYREQDFGDSWSPKHNVIVGRNGSGKSNFFAAVQFVLSEKFANLRTEERKQLFHEGAGKAYTVYVEIIFDNSDGRLVIPGRPDESEVKIRRTLGLKQDEFRVNDRKFSASEVRQLLESAGFSSSNPYYIVEQGKIIDLARMRAEDRYGLLKDVAGTKVYENRRAESVEILGSTEEKMGKVNDAIGQLDDRMRQLEAETSELKQYQAADHKRRLLEYSIFDVELTAAKQGLERLDAQANARLTKAGDEDVEQTRLQTALDDAIAVAARVNGELADAEKDRSLVEREMDALRDRHNRWQLQASESHDSTDRNERELKALRAESAELTKVLEKARNDLKAKRTQEQERKRDAAVAADKMSANEAALEALQAKRGRRTQFASKNERDQWLRDEIARNERLLSDNEAQIAKLKAARTTVQKQIKDDEAQADSLKKSVSKADTAATRDESTRTELIAQRDQLGAARRSKWGEVHQLEGALRRAKDASERARQKYEKAVRFDIRQGLQSLHEILNELGDERLRKAVHGQVIDLMKLDPRVTTAVDVCAGNALFNVVVDSFEVSSLLLDNINRKKKPGRITFFPLDTCKTRPKDLPSTPAYTPLLSHITYDSKFGSVFAELFGRTLLVKQLETGPQAVKEFDCDAITYDGDQFSRKGGITGGFIDVRSKIRAAAELKAAMSAEVDAKAALDAMLQEVATLEQRITGLIQQLETSGSQGESGRAATEQAMHDLRAAEERVSRGKRALEQNVHATEVLERSSATIQQTVNTLKGELASGFQSTWSTEQEQELARLQALVSGERAKLDALQSAAVQAQTDCQMLDDTVHHLERRLTRAQDRMRILEQTKPAATVADKELSAAAAELADAKNRLAAIEQQVEKAVNQRRKHEEAVAAARQALIQFQRSQQDRKDNVDRAHNQRALMLQQKEAAQAKIRRVGAVSAAEAAVYSGHAPGKLMQLLREVNEELKKFAHVNKKALDQYAQLTDSRKDMHDQRAALDKEHDSVKKLIAHLDKQKDEAISRTFKQVQHHFEEVFTDLVRAEGCKASLSLMESDRETIRAGGDPYASVKIEVTFGAGTPNAELAQLSGGQKSLVALALIFAIQRCDPAPFYLFDEIDAALDAEYRTNVASMIKEQAQNCQFITATFKTEMLAAADATFGIFFQNKVSQIRPVSRAEAEAILKQAAMEDRKRDREGTFDRADVDHAPPSRSTPAR